MSSIMVWWYGWLWRIWSLGLASWTSWSNIAFERVVVLFGQKSTSVRRCEKAIVASPICSPTISTFCAIPYLVSVTKVTTMGLLGVWANTHNALLSSRFIWGNLCRKKPGVRDCQWPMRERQTVASLLTCFCYDDHALTMVPTTPNSPRKITLMVFYHTPIYSSYISPPIDCHSRPKTPAEHEIVATKVGACSESKARSSSMIGHW